MLPGVNSDEADEEAVLLRLRWTRRLGLRDEDEEEEARLGLVLRWVVVVVAVVVKESMFGCFVCLVVCLLVHWY